MEVISPLRLVLPTSVRRLRVIDGQCRLCKRQQPVQERPGRTSQSAALDGGQRIRPSAEHEQGAYKWIEVNLPAMVEEAIRIRKEFTG